MTQNNYYKLRAIETYISTEWLADGKKKYRTVFDKEEVAYLYVELSLFNKQFDRNDWKAQLTLECYKIDQGEELEICCLNINTEIKAEEPIAFIREGWGHQDKGQFWNHGTYRWDISLRLPSPIAEQQISAPINPKKEENELVLIGQHQFHIERRGIVNLKYNPYFDPKLLRLFEGSYTEKANSERKFVEHFLKSNTEYVWAEFIFKNKHLTHWFCEVFFNFYNAEGQLKGQLRKFKKIDMNEQEVILTAGWGSTTKGTWFKDTYRIDIVFMGVIMISKTFNVY